jgi:hypothetical protein
VQIPAPPLFLRSGRPIADPASFVAVIRESPPISKSANTGARGRIDIPQWRQLERGDIVGVYWLPVGPSRGFALVKR